jgi:hypothetical protein
MKNDLARILGALIVVGVLAVPSPARAGWLVGGAMKITVDDSPLGTNFTQDVTLAAGTTTLDRGELMLTQKLIPAGPGREWLILDFQATGSHLLAANPGIFWEISAVAPVSFPGLVTQAFLDWTTDGVWYDATRPIGIVPVISNPLGTDPANVFGATTQPPWPATVKFNLFAYISPYDDISLGGLNPKAVNGYVMGGLLVSSVPEPPSVVLAATGGVVMIGVALCRRRKGQGRSRSGRAPADAEAPGEVRGIPTLRPARRPRRRLEFVADLETTESPLEESPSGIASR